MRACQRDSVSRCLRPPLLCCLVTLGYQDAQHRTEAPLSPTASDTEVLCWSVCTQVPSKASVHNYSAGPAPTCHSAVSAPVQVAFQPTPPHLLVCSHVVANLPSEAAVLKPTGNRGKAGRGRTPWCCDCRGSYSSMLYAHTLFLPSWGSEDGVPVSASREPEVFPVPDVLGTQ